MKQQLCQINHWRLLIFDYDILFQFLSRVKFSTVYYLATIPSFHKSWRKEELAYFFENLIAKHAW